MDTGASASLSLVHIAMPPNSFYISATDHYLFGIDAGALFMILVLPSICYHGPARNLD